MAQLTETFALSKANASNLQNIRKLNLWCDLFLSRFVLVA